VGNTFLVRRSIWYEVYVWKNPEFHHPILLPSDNIIVGHSGDRFDIFGSTAIESSAALDLWYAGVPFDSQYSMQRILIIRCCAYCHITSELQIQRIILLSDVGFCLLRIYQIANTKHALLILGFLPRFHLQNSLGVSTDGELSEHIQYFITSLSSLYHNIGWSLAVANNINLE
jgi:hypothetical protein